MGRPRKFDEGTVIDAAMDTFWRRGYQATSTRDLNDSTGVGPSSLYNTFGDKRQLYLRALRGYYEAGTGRQLEIVRRPGPAKERLRDLIVTAIDVDLGTDLDGVGPTGCFAINAAIEMAATDPEIKEEVRRHFSRVEELLRETIDRGQRAGEIDPTRDATALARQVLSMYYGLRVLGRVETDRAKLLEVLESTLASL